MGSRHGQAGPRGEAIPDAAPGPAPWITGAPLLARAYWLAKSAHRSQRRPSDGRPFLDHVVEVATLLHEAGFDEELIAVGLLHDAVERGTLTGAELRSEMGREICSLVLTLSEDPSIRSFDERKEGLREQVRRAGGRAVTVFAADKLSDILGLRLALESGNDVDARIDTTVAGMAGHYRESVQVIESERPGSVFLPALRVQLDRLAAEARTPSARASAA